MPPHKTLSSAAPDGPLVYLSTHYIQTKEYLEAIVASTSDAICTTDLDGKVIFFSPGAEKMFQTPARSAVGLPAYRFYEGGAAESRRLMRHLLEHGTLSNHEMKVNVQGKTIHISMSAALLRDKEGVPIGTLGISKDISERVELEKRLRDLSITDNLTGLYNQRHLFERGKMEVQRAARRKEDLSVVMIDVDKFKRVNDTYGHLVGDRLLCNVSDAIKKSIRSEVDSAFRYGGDEFVIILPGLAAEQADTVMRRIQKPLSSSSLHISLSFGIASLKAHDTFDKVLKRADRRMYEAKKLRSKLGK